MLKHLYGIFDLVAGVMVSDVVQLFPSEAPARRMFSDVVRAPDSQFAKHPEDYVLVYLGAVRLDTLAVVDVYEGEAEVAFGHRAVVMRAGEVLESVG